MAPSSDASLPAEFGVVDQQIDPRWLADPRLPTFLRWLADGIEADQLPEGEAVFPASWSDLRVDERWARDRRSGIEELLDAQLNQDHVLYGLELEAIGACDQNESVLLRIDDGRYAVVNLEFIRTKSRSADFPFTVIHDVWASAAGYLRTHHLQ